MDIFISVVIILSLIGVVGWMSFDLFRTIKKYRESKKNSKEFIDDGRKNESQEDEHIK